MYELKREGDTDTTVLGLFPTPLYTTIIPNEFSVAANFFDNLEHETNKGGKEIDYGTHSKNTYVMHEPECKDLADWILVRVKDFAESVLRYDYEDYTFSQTWVTFKEPGQSHIAHSHPNSLISAVFFYGYGTDETPAITFHKMSGMHSMPNLQAKVKSDRTDAEFSWDTFNISFQPGLLIIFPSHFYHSVPKNTTDFTRKSLSMNIVPKGKLGDPNSLTELWFEKVI
tara:strand:- start:1093 stop:1773 length:681 start_codon:yes stop_codon:yes gene_type:complete